MNKYLLLYVLIFSFSSTDSLACDFKKPHSFSCQHKTFVREIFPVFEMRLGLLNNNWHPSQFTPAQGSHSPTFRTVKAKGNVHRTCGVVDSRGLLMGPLRLKLSKKSIREVSIKPFQGKKFRTNRAPFFEDRFSLAFGNTSSKDLFRCRLFDRVNIPHLTCQYFKNGKFVGYLGFLPQKVSCD